MLRLVSEQPRPLHELDAEAVAALERDGLVQVEQGTVELPALTAARRPPR